MKIYKYSDRWYIARGNLKGRRVFGAGITFDSALYEALRA